MPTSETPPRIRQWDVVVLPFPYADRLAEKRRPAVVVSKPSLTAEYGIFWVAMITSAANAGWKCDIPIAESPATGLTAPSVIRPWKLATVDAGRIVRIAGRISRDDQARLARTLRETI
jgi:mRNA interferase MazF